MHEGWLKNIIEKYITNALFCILKKEKKNSASSAPLSHQPPTTPNFLLSPTPPMPSTPLHVFTSSIATSCHEASFWLANAWRTLKKERKKIGAWSFRCLNEHAVRCYLQHCKYVEVAVLKYLVVVAMRHRSCISMMNNHWKGDKLSEKRLCSVETQSACITWPGTWMRIIMYSCPANTFPVPFSERERSADLNKQ